MSVNREALDWLRLASEKQFPRSLGHILDIKANTNAISQESHAAYKALLGENEVVLNAGDIVALNKDLREGKGDERIRRFIGSRFLDLRAIFPKARESVIEAVKIRMPGTVNLAEIPKHIKAIREGLLQEAERTQITKIESDLKSRTPTISGMPVLEVREAV